MRSTKKLSHNHVKCVIYHHRLAVNGRTSCGRKAQKPEVSGFSFLTCKFSVVFIFPSITYRWCYETSWRSALRGPTHAGCKTPNPAEQRPQTDLHWTRMTPLTQSGKERFHKRQNLLEDRTARNYRPVIPQRFTENRDRTEGEPAVMQLKSRGARSWILRPWNSKGLAQ